MGIVTWPAWLETLLPMVVKITIILALAPVGMMYLTWFERKVVARIQDRFGPNRVGPYGLLQPLADGIKMVTKEDLIPDGADRLCHFLAPILIVVPALYLFTVLPFGEGIVAVPLVTGLLFFVAIGSTEALALFMAAWGSRNKFALLGALRNAAQVIAYEVPVVLALAAVPMIAGSLNLNEIVRAQSGGWFVATPWGFTAALLVTLGGLAEVNRTPFDLAEAESELVGGFHTEYSGMKFALFYMAEFLSTLALGALVAVLFLGGWLGPKFLPGPVWMGLKTMALVFVMVWIRGTWPRFRIDQLMGLAWKVMVPLALANLLGAALWSFCPGAAGWLASAALSVAVFLVTTQLWLAPKPKTPTHWAGKY
ncbi:MAG: NADH-quinone oxidoreductase subunit NuoH [Candidatus Omnitrophica bacterium CG11_big_fil_rev_8_21_14_0_20_64_10]|nr:MAG: NADH-quinone oxidoreductase subunit NuoH [Candidatus Omnitrophica bacterium CG11_big_fil_rev_8_21_14_0_20_64_10]